MSTKTSRRSTLAALSTLAAVMVPGAATALSGLPTQPADDPVFAAIDRHRSAWLMIDTLLDGTEEYDDAFDEAIDAYWCLLENPPTTAAGFAAMFDYLAETDEGGESTLSLAIHNWSGTPPGQTEHLHAADWLKLLAAAMRKLPVETRS